jgi:sterol O-acyltransferase
LYPWHKDDTDGPAVWYGGQMSPSVGSFSQYCYFLFSPTLLYRDHYPRNPGPVNWLKVIMYLITVCTPSLHSDYCILSQFYIPLEISGYVFKKHVSPSAIK